MEKSYFKELGGFDERNDHDAALKFSLSLVLMDRSFAMLLKLLTPNSGVEGFGGDPGWVIERRSVVDEEENAGWPDWAEFRAHVDPSGYRLGYPEGFYKLHQFLSFVRRGLDGYEKRHKSGDDDFRAVSSLVSDLLKIKQE